MSNPTREGSFLASNGKWVHRNGGYVGFGDTEQQAFERSQDGNPSSVFLFGAEWAALTELLAATDGVGNE